jgi:CBS domain containing-hemolysin-like protein
MGIGLCLLLEACFAAIEIALLSCNRIQIQYLADRKNIRARWVNRFLAKPANFLSTTMIGVNLVTVISASLSAHVASLFFNENLAPFIATVCLWPLIVLFAEFIPMSIALAHPLQVSLWGILGLKIAYFIFYPFVRLVAGISSMVNKFVGGKGDLASPYFTRDEFRLLFKGEQKEIFDTGEQRMIRGVFEFHKAKIHQIMVPLRKVVSCSVDKTVGDVKRIIFDSAFSRIPIYKHRVSNIVGTVHAMDLIGLEDNLLIEKVMKAPIKFSQSKAAAEALRTMWGHQLYMAIVTESHNRCVGLVTLEDILEEIVGEIEDEYDEITLPGTVL